MSLRKGAIRLAMAVSAALQTACISVPRVRHARAAYASALVEVSRPEETTARWGAVERIARGDANRYVYEDSMVRVLIAADSQSIRFAMTNKTQHPVAILWDEVRFVDTEGKTSKVMHAGTKPEDRELPQTPSVIAARATFDGAAWPIDRLWRTMGFRYQVGNSTVRVPPGWAHRALVSPDYSGATEAKRNVPFTPDSAWVARVRANVGRRMGLVLPLQVEGVTNAYTFWFRVTDAAVSISEPYVK
jgi:hypothetical protein